MEESHTVLEYISDSSTTQQLKNVTKATCVKSVAVRKEIAGHNKESFTILGNLAGHCYQNKGYSDLNR